MEAIVKAPYPKDINQLQSYLGLINYYRKFVPHLATEMKELYELLKNNVKFEWSEKCSRAFKKSKKLITENNFLELYDPKKPIIVAADASPYGVGAVLSHVVNGVEKPVLFASSSLSPAERNYSQLHREALAIIFAVKKFDRYIYGNEFTIVTDHQSLCEIFNPSKNTPAVAAARLQRWSIILSMYNYKIVHRSGVKMGNVDALSRLPLKEGSNVEEIQIVNFLNFSNILPITKENIKQRIAEDEILSKVYKFVMIGWSYDKILTSEILQYHAKSKSLSTEDGCLFYGNRIIVPKSLQDNILRWIHENHLGIVRMKMVARSYVWWPSINVDIESYVRNCHVCQSTQNVPRKEETTKWKECTDTKKVLNEFIQFFTIYGLPKTIVTDNGPPFNSYDFKFFCERHNIQLLHSPSYHPQSNGLAERNVCTVKSVLKKFLLCVDKNLSISNRLNKFLIHYRNTPVMSTGSTPNDKMFGYKQTTILDALKSEPKEAESSTDIHR